MMEGSSYRSNSRERRWMLTDTSPAVFKTVCGLWKPERLAHIPYVGVGTALLSIRAWYGETGLLSRAPWVVSGGAESAAFIAP